MEKVRVLVVDDHALVRLGLMTLIDDQADMQVVGEAGSASEAVRKVDQLQPDIVLMDIRMPGEGGIHATQQVTANFPKTHVIILTSFTEDELVLRAIQAGAAGYVLKQADNEDLLRAIRAVSRGEALLDPVTTARMLNKMRELSHKADRDAFRDLSERELEVLAELTRGKTNAEIAAKLHLSEKTVRNHVSTILDKLQMNNRVELATFAVEHHIFDRIDHLNRT
ncbi:MAG: DNA-binding response regulator [Chloroflexi bacterium]|nr:MAG: DNA-binding response regulator [Chloroflexota bacterium]